MVYEPMVLREDQCRSYICLTDTDVEAYCDENEGHGPDHVCKMLEGGLVLGRDSDEVIGDADELTLDMEAALEVYVEIRWTWPK